MARVNLVGIWLVVSAWAVCSGWTLSAARQLHGLGWTFAAAVLAGLLWHGMRAGSWLRDPGFPRHSLPVRWWRWRRRFYTPLPALFAAVAFLSLVGGAIHPPNNYDALSYRLPRMLHWLAEERWHWITTPNERMNYAGVGFEWLQTPLFLLTGGDRWLFLLNLVTFILLPGLLFRFFRVLGVSGRPARFWMWFLPVSYGYALQAGAIGNDSFSVVYAMAGVCFGLEARRTRSMRSLSLALLAAALLTGIKASNLPLALPVLIACGPALAALWRRPVSGMVLSLFCIAVSFIPVAAINHRLAGHWSGDPSNTSLMRLSDPLAGLVGNSLQLAAQGAIPPVMPLARRIGPWLLEAMPEGFRNWLRAGFPRFSFQLGELPQEEVAGFGLGCTVLLLALVLAGMRSWRRLPVVLQAGPSRARTGIWVCAAGYLATLVFMSKLGSEATARLLQPYYPFWILPLLLPNRAKALHRRRWWNVLAMVSAVSTLAVLVLTPARPLLPMEPLLIRLAQARPNNSQLSRAREVYAVYHTRNDALAPLRSHLPGPVTVIGFLGDEDDMEYALWRPFGGRRVVHLSDGRRIDPEAPPPMEWVVVKQAVWERLAGLSWEHWLARHGGELVARETIVSKVSAGPETWWVARFPAMAR